MNRQQRRREKRKKNPTYNLTAEQIATIGKSYEDEVIKATDKNIKEESEQIILKLMTLTLYIPLLVQRNHGFGKKRLKKFAEEMIEQLEYYEDKAFTIEEIKDVIKDETGLELEFELDFKNQKSTVRTVEK